MTPARLPLLLLAAALGAGCAVRPLTPLASDPRPLAGPWASPLQRDHPLAGRILDVPGRRWVDQAILDAALARADLLLLGETHDNPDHHLLQAREIRAVTATGRSPALTLEMIDPTQQQQVDDALAKGGATADGLAEALDWPKSKWPPFAIYRPVFEAGLAARLPFVAANLSRATARELMKMGPEVLGEEVQGWLARAPALTPAQVEAQAKEMAEEHCGELPHDLLQPLLLAQRARDAQLAARTAGAAGPGGAILVVGAGHVRRDRAVPAWLAREAPGRTVLAVAHLEVEGGKRHPDDYLADFGVVDFGGALPFDFVIFTPAAVREDPCTKLKRQQAEKKAGGP
jgi:uncharacterized iron-regulated protein